MDRMLRKVWMTVTTTVVTLSSEISMDTPLPLTSNVVFDLVQHTIQLVVLSTVFESTRYPYFVSVCISTSTLSLPVANLQYHRDLSLFLRN